MQWSERIGRRLKLRDLHILTEVVQSGSMAKAANRLAISTPVVSKAISDLEHIVGVRLLDRSVLGVEATIYGRALIKWSTAAFDDLRQGIKEIEFLTDPTVGELRIGSSPVYVEGFVPLILNRLHRYHPRLTFDVTQASAGPALNRELRERNVDLILSRMSMPIEDEDLSAEILFDEPHFVVAGSRNRWVGRRSIELSELIDEPWILPPPGTRARNTYTETFAACGLPMPRANLVSSSTQLNTTMLASGGLLTMWPATTLRFGARHRSIKVLPVKLPVLPRPVGIIILKGRMISPVTQLFIDAAREVAKSLPNVKLK
jgi:DNA-binding transcriptional LysR family regulator